jgi:hypothetical protein
MLLLVLSWVIIVIVTLVRILLRSLALTPLFIPSISAASLGPRVSSSVSWTTLSAVTRATWPTRDEVRLVYKFSGVIEVVLFEHLFESNFVEFLIKNFLMLVENVFIHKLC